MSRYDFDKNILTFTEILNFAKDNSVNSDKLIKKLGVYRWLRIVNQNIGSYEAIELFNVLELINLAWQFQNVSFKWFTCHSETAINYIHYTKWKRVINPSTPIPWRGDDNTDLSSKSNISKTVRVNISFTKAFFKEYLVSFLIACWLIELHLWFSSCW